jgi:uncharacterized membrane protein YdjX (TVP38/TMEM64 family)
MHGLTNGQLSSHGFVRSALLVTACILGVGLVLLPVALKQDGSGSVLGLLTAGAVCLIAAIVAEALSCLLARTGPPLAALLVSTAVRFTPPLFVCFYLAATGATGRQHLAFVCYLLAFYLATLAVETWLAVSRVLPKSPNQDVNGR